MRKANKIWTPNPKPTTFHCTLFRFSLNRNAIARMKIIPKNPLKIEMKDISNVLI